MKKPNTIWERLRYYFKQILDLLEAVICGDVISNKEEIEAEKKSQYWAIAAIVIFIIFVAWMARLGY